MSTDETKQERDATIEQLEGYPDSRAFDIDIAERGLVLIGVNVDGERRRMFVGRGLMPGVKDAVDAYAEEALAREPTREEFDRMMREDDDRDDDRCDDDDCQDEIDSLKGELEEARRDLHEQAAQHAAKIKEMSEREAVGNIDRKNLRDRIRELEEQPLKAVAEALDLDPRTTVMAIVGQIAAMRRQRADTGHRVKRSAGAWSLTLAQALHDRYETDGQDKHGASTWELVEALGYVLRDLTTARAKLQRYEIDDEARGSADDGSRAHP